LRGGAANAASPRKFQTAKEPENKSTQTIFCKGKRNFLIFMHPELKIPPAETPNEAPKPEVKKVGRGLYDINEGEGGFEVILPGLFDRKRELIVGTRRENFATREEAEQAIARSRESDRILFERASLEKTYQKHFFRIDETKDGKFRVVLPCLVDSKNGYYVGTSYREFDTWDEAKEHFLQSRENEERLSQKPLLEVQTGESKKIAFSQLDAFNPRVAPSEQQHEIPDSIRTYLMGKGRLDGTEPSASTYQEKRLGTKTFFVRFFLSRKRRRGNPKRIGN
jgi:hypothetical protein